MYKRFILLILLMAAVLNTSACADELVGLADITVTNDELVSLRYEGKEYVVADEDLTLGTTTRWYVVGGVETLWPEGDPVPPEAPTVPNASSDAKDGDVGSKADNFFFRVGGSNDISSIDGIDFQETIFPFLTRTIFVFERNGNDNGTVQPILVDGSLGPAMTLTANGPPYASTGVDVAGQTAYGYVVKTDVPVQGVRITAEGHDTLTICMPAPIPLTATKPNPADGAVYEQTWVTLTWSPGDKAVSHDVYLGDNFDDVNDADNTSAAFRGNQAAELIIAGFIGYPYPDGLIPGTTYYWRINEVNDLDPNSPWRGAVWSFSIPSSNAYEPIPSDGASFVDPEVTLNWSPGLNAKLHMVYFGDSFDDVNNATEGTASATTSFEPGTLELGKTYYWRVDESDPPSTVKGEIWSFTTTLPGLGTAVMDRWENITTTDINALKNDVRYPNNPTVTETVDSFLWNGDDIDNYGARIEGWLYVPATGDYTFWLNTDDHGELWLSTDDDSSNAVLIAQESSYSGFGAWGTGEEQSDPVPLIGGEKYYISALWKEGTGGDHCQVAWQGPGIGERTVIPGTNLSPFEPLTAFGANPANRAVDVSQTPILQWKAGLEAASHEVYFGTDADAIANATKASPEFVGTRQLGSETYEPATLAWNTAYYWRVDEINTANPDSPWVGNVWSFTTANFGIVDDFESYNDTDNLVYERYQDGVNNPNVNGSTIGYFTGASMESDTVHGGNLSVPFEYKNSPATISEVTLNFTPAQDWTANGITTLSLWFAGDPANVPGQFYVKVNGVRVNYDGDASNLTRVVWQVWNIDLTAINTNMSRVTSFAFGIQGPGANGTLLLDDIRLLSSVLERPSAVLVHHWPLDTDGTDLVGGLNGTVQGPAVVPGKAGNGLSFDGQNDSVELTGFVPSLQGTFVFWMNAASVGSRGRFMGSVDQFEAYVENGLLANQLFAAGGLPNYIESSTVLAENTWYHVALTYDGVSHLQQIYINGQLDAEGMTADDTWNGGNFAFGHRADRANEYYSGILDDVQYYDQVLTIEEVQQLMN